MLLTETRPAQLSAAMREGSRVEHEEAESSAFMAELLDGRVNDLGYATYLARYRGIYAALEDAVRGCDAPAIEAVYDVRLERLATIEADLTYWRQRVSAPIEATSPATEAYIARLHEVAHDGGLLAAHHYTRYLGDLSGGQAIGRILNRSFELDGQGIAFYDFSAIAKPKIFKDGYRERLDALELSGADQDRIVDEVRLAFRLNSDMFAELGERLADFRR